VTQGKRVFPLGHWLCVSVDATRTQERGEEEDEEEENSPSAWALVSSFICVCRFRTYERK